MSIRQGNNLIAGTPDLSNKADSDLSNLSSTGQKVIDGQWVHRQVNIFNSVALTTTAKRYSLSSYLPDDGCDYEVLAQLGTGNSAAVNIRSDLGFHCTSRSSGSAQVYNACVLPVGTERYIEASTVSATSSNSTCTLIGYRRIGTNS